MAIKFYVYANLNCVEICLEAYIVMGRQLKSEETSDIRVAYSLTFVYEMLNWHVKCAVCVNPSENWDLNSYENKHYDNILLQDCLFLGLSIFSKKSIFSNFWHLKYKKNILDIDHFLVLEYFYFANLGS